MSGRTIDGDYFFLSFGLSNQWLFGSCFFQNMLLLGTSESRLAKEFLRGDPKIIYLERNTSCVFQEELKNYDQRLHGHDLEGVGGRKKPFLSCKEWWRFSVYIPVDLRCKLYVLCGEARGALLTSSGCTWLVLPSWNLSAARGLTGNSPRFVLSLVCILDMEWHYQSNPPFPHRCCAKHNKQQRFCWLSLAFHLTVCDKTVCLECQTWPCQQSFWEFVNFKWYKAVGPMKVGGTWVLFYLRKICLQQTIELIEFRAYGISFSFIIHSSFLARE